MQLAWQEFRFMNNSVNEIYRQIPLTLCQLSVAFVGNKIALQNCCIILRWVASAVYMCVFILTTVLHRVGYDFRCVLFKFLA